MLSRRPLPSGKRHRCSFRIAEPLQHRHSSVVVLSSGHDGERHCAESSPATSAFVYELRALQERHTNGVRRRPWQRPDTACRRATGRQRSSSRRKSSSAWARSRPIRSWDDAKVGELRGHWIESPWAPNTLVTAHPSAILRERDSDSRHAAFAAFVADLREVAGRISASG